MNHLNEEISVTVIATGFESNSIFQPYKRKEPSKVELVPGNNVVPRRVTPEKGDDVFSVHDKGKKSIITDFEEESQGVIDFSLEHSENMNEYQGKKADEEMVRQGKSRKQHCER